MKEFTSGLDLFEETWQKAPKIKKIELLKSVDAHPSFAETKTVKEMVARGGGLAASSLLRVHTKYIQSKGGKVRINDW
jgi:hypothetical protein